MKQFLLLSMLIFFLSTYGQKKEDDFLLSYIDSSSGHELYGYKSQAGKIIIKAKFALADDTMRAMAFVLGKNGWAGIDRHEKVILKPFIFDNGPDYVEEGLFRFVENNKMGFANMNGQKIIPAQFGFVTPFENGIANYTLGGHKQYLDSLDGHWVWTGGYENGYINKAGKRFKKISELKSNKTEAWTFDNKHVLLDKNGEVIKTFKD